VRQQTFSLDAPVPQEDLRALSMVINDRSRDASVERIEQQLAQTDSDVHYRADLEQRVLDLVVRAMHQFEDQVNRQIYSDGLIEVLSQPEFIPALLKEEDASRAIGRMRQVLETLTSTSALNTLIVQALTNEGVHIVIGTEHDRDDMHDYSVVLSRYGVDGEAIGVLGVIGPTRMAYPRSISTVRYISTVMSDMLSILYGGEERSSRSAS
jgi:heat-inducible transcriptional repressor